MTVFYFCSSICDWFYLWGGKKELVNGGLICINHAFMIPTDATGSLILLFYTLVSYSYAVVVLYVFYFLPKKSGLVLDLTVSGSLLLTNSTRNLMSDSMVL